MESCLGLSLSQIGLIFDIVGFIIILIFGGFQFGLSVYTADEYKPHVLPLRIIGSLLVIVGFAFQIFGAG